MNEYVVSHKHFGDVIVHAEGFTPGENWVTFSSWKDGGEDTVAAIPSSWVYAVRESGQPGIGE